MKRPKGRGHQPGRQSWWSARRASGQWPGLGSPPCATRLLVGGDNGAVDQGVFEVRLAGQACEDALEDAALHPTAEPLGDAVSAAQIPPRSRPPPPTGGPGERRCPSDRNRPAGRAGVRPPPPATAPPRETAGCP